MLNIVLFGPPGAGKGTQSANLINKYNLVHISTGDLLRSEIAGATPLGLKAQDYMKKGLLVPDELVIEMIEHKLKENKSAVGFIFDGFPRTIPQAEALDRLLISNRTPINAVIALEVQEAELIKRILERGKTSGRPDDQSEVLVKRRVQEYHSKTEPVAGFYDKQHKLHRISGIGTIEEIFENISSVVDSYLQHKA